MQEVSLNEVMINIANLLTSQSIKYGVEKKIAKFSLMSP